jgi:hypothetical protein
MRVCLAVVSFLERIAMPPETSCCIFSGERIVQLLSTLLVCCLAFELALAEDVFSPLNLTS